MSEMHDSTNEIWKPVVGYEAIYSVSNLGRVRSDAAGRSRKQGKCLRPSHVDGYARVVLCDDRGQKSRTVHRMVAESHIGKCPAGCQINHKNGVRGDNRVENLEWVTPTENNRHKDSVLGHGSQGDRHGMAKLTWTDVDLIRSEYVLRKVTQAVLAARFGVSPTSINHVLHGLRWARKHA